MTTEFERWYDKNDDISQLLKFLEIIDTRNRKVIANEILQIIFSELSVNLNEKIKDLGNISHECNKRWYDEDTEVQSAIEIIKSLSPQQHQELIEHIVETLQQFIIKSEGI